MSNHETPQRKKPETAANSHETATQHHERVEALRTSLEKEEQRHKKTSKESMESLKQEALVHAKETAADLVRTEQSPSETRGLFTKRHREESFKKQLDTIQPHLSTSERLLSRIIHTKPIEATSDAVGSTVARPNAMLAGSICAFLLVTIVYFTAKYYGYPLSGSETIGAFIIGWIIGLIYDYCHILIKGTPKS
ncbi:MAG: hypothetical protein WAS27_02950 [Candidatus Saccharimonadales bacterium]